MGDLVRGQHKEVVFTFQNTGTKDLVIEVVTACKCTEIIFPRKAIAPGGRGEIRAIYDTTTQELGEVRKTLDIIANTDPIVVEAFFRANIVEGKREE